MLQVLVGRNVPEISQYGGSFLGAVTVRAFSFHRHTVNAEIAKLPSVPRQILKDIPRPPNSASRDD